jgi:hypothetical protein
MICLICPNCQSRLNAKDELLGQTRNCPKCGQPVLIAVPDTPPDLPQEVAPGEPVYDLGQPGLPQPDVPKRLDRHNHYLICDRSKLMAAWKDDGQGWLLRTNAGLVSAVRNADQLPNQGDFKLVELRLERTAAGPRLVGIRSYQLAQRWALTSLDKGDDKIVSKVTGLGCLNRDQKNVVRQAIKDHLMREVWAEAKNVLEYLASTDYHSPGTD